MFQGATADRLMRLLIAKPELATLVASSSGGSHVNPARDST